MGGGGERQDLDWYTAHGIRFQGGTRVADIDVHSKTVQCDDGTAYGYDKLIVATGAEVGSALPPYLMH